MADGLDLLLMALGLLGSLAATIMAPLSGMFLGEWAQEEVKKIMCERVGLNGSLCSSQLHAQNRSDYFCTSTSITQHHDHAFS